MKTKSILLMLVGISLAACNPKSAVQTFESRYDKNKYTQIAKSKDINNEKQIDKLWANKVNIENIEKFKQIDIDLKQSLYRDYKSRVLISDAILTGKIISKEEFDRSDVKFHTAYKVAVTSVVKKPDWPLLDAITIMLIYGPAGNGMYAAQIAGTDNYSVGEQVVLYLEAMEKTFSSYEEYAPEAIDKINADRNDLNVFRPLKKYILKENKLYDHVNRGKREVGKKKKVFKDIKRIIKLNEL